MGHRRGVRRVAGVLAAAVIAGTAGVVAADDDYSPSSMLEAAKDLGSRDSSVATPVDPTMRDARYTWDAPMAGMPIFLSESPGAAIGGQCSAGAFATDNDTGKHVMITAGHCAVGDNHPTFTEVRWGAAGEGGAQPLGRLDTALQTTGEGSEGKPSYGEIKDMSPASADYAIYRLGESVEASPKIAGFYDVVGVAFPGDLKSGVEICRFGATTGEGCGPVVTSDGKEGVLYANLPGYRGDSGGPAYIKVGGNQVLLVGMFSTTDSALADKLGVDSAAIPLLSGFSPIWPVLEAYNLSLNGERGYLHR